MFFLFSLLCSLLLLAVGDSIKYLDYAKDKLLGSTNTINSMPKGPTTFARFLGEFGLRDPRRSCWKLNTFWLPLLPDPDPIVDSLTAFFAYNIGTADLEVVWDASKAHLGGQFIKHINYIKTKAKSWENPVLTDVQRTESNYIDNPSDTTKRG